ncbi:MAG: LPS export ABC transporter permease LptG [Pseudomonadota bacterium]
MTLHFYFARRFTVAFGLITAVISAFVMLIDMVEETRRFDRYDLSWGEIFQLTLLSTPQTLNLILPLLIMLTTLALFLSLAKSSELVVTRAVGRSAFKSLIAPGSVAFLIGVLAVGVFNPIASATGNRYVQLSESHRADGVPALSISDEGLWLRQGTAEGQTVIRALRANADASTLYDVTFLSYDAQNGLNQRISAKSARLSGDVWRLSDVKIWPLETGINAEAAARSIDRFDLPSTLTLERIRERIGKAAAVSIYDMPRFIDQLEQSGLNALQHRVWLHSEFARPFFLVAMVLIASAFTMRHTRLGGTGIAVLSAVLLGFSLYFVRSFTQILGENGELPVVLAAWAPPTVAILLALSLLLHAEDG